MADVQTRNNRSAKRYEALVENEVAGFSAYQLTDLLVVFTHTEVDDAYEGQGVGSALARAALDDVRDQGSRKVLPVCPFIKSWIEKHPEYADLVYGAPRSTAKD
jgi:predicted GNAT family acetyltransferase